MPTSTREMLERLNAHPVPNKPAPKPQELLQEEEVDEKSLSSNKLPRLVFTGSKVNEEDLENQDGQLYQANVPLEQIKLEFDQFLEQLAKENNTSVEELKNLGYKAEMQGNNVLVVTMPEQEGQQFMQMLAGKGMINLPKPELEQAVSQDSASNSPSPSSSLPNPFKMTPSPFN